MRIQNFSNYRLASEEVCQTSSQVCSFMFKTSLTKGEMLVKQPDFCIVVSPSKRKRLADAEGDYDILILKDSGETIPLEFGYRGDKMFYLLTLLCQKRTGGLPTKFFSFDSSKNAIKKVYDEVFRVGGDVWVDTMAKDSHKLSVCRSHAKLAIENNPLLDWNMVYWCSLSTTPLFVGSKGKKLNIRKVKLPNERIVIKDNKKLTQLLDSLPTLEQVVGPSMLNSSFKKRI